MFQKKNLVLIDNRSADISSVTSIIHCTYTNHAVIVVIVTTMINNVVVVVFVCCFFIFNGRIGRMGSFDFTRVQNFIARLPQQINIVYPLLFWWFYFQVVCAPFNPLPVVIVCTVYGRVCTDTQSADRNYMYTCQLHPSGLLLRPRGTHTV